MAPDEIRITYPDWVTRVVDWENRYVSNEDRMRLAIALARENVATGTGGPFGAAVFKQSSGVVIAVGMNLVLPLRNSVLHAEVVALMMAERRLDCYTLGEHQLVTSCEPCAMCLGAVHWSGVQSLLCGAAREDAERIKFDEGPVFPESYAYLEKRGLRITRGVCRQESREVLEMYARQSGVIY